MTDISPEIIIQPFYMHPIFLHGIVAVFGAITHALRSHRMGESKGFLDFALLTIMSSFSGLMFALLSFQIFENSYVTLACAGAGGFLGVEALTIITTKIRDSLAFSVTKK